MNFNILPLRCLTAKESVPSCAVFFISHGCYLQDEIATNLARTLTTPSQNREPASNPASGVTVEGLKKKKTIPNLSNRKVITTIKVFYHDYPYVYDDKSCHKMFVSFANPAACIFV